MDVSPPSPSPAPSPSTTPQMHVQKAAGYLLGLLLASKGTGLGWEWAGWGGLGGGTAQLMQHMSPPSQEADTVGMPVREGAALFQAS